MSDQCNQRKQQQQQQHQQRQREIGKTISWEKQQQQKSHQKKLTNVRTANDREGRINVQWIAVTDQAKSGRLVHRGHLPHDGIRRPIRGNFHRFNKARIVTGPLPTFKTAAANHKEGELVEEQ